MTQTARDLARRPDGAPDAGGPPGLRWAGRRVAEATARGTVWCLGWYAALPPRRRELAEDSALALGLAVLNLGSIVPYADKMHPAWLAFLLVGGQCLPLAVRRRWPVPALIASGFIRNLYDAQSFGYAPLPLAVAIGVATVAERSNLLLRWLTVAGIAAGLSLSQRQPGHNQPYDAIVQVFIFGAAIAIGLASRYRRAAFNAAAERAARAEASLGEAAFRAAAAERVRIARELHDVVAHHVSLMAVQAEAVGALLPARPQAAAESADLIGSTARAAMTELRRLLGVLRFKDHNQEDPERLRLTPAPSMSRLDELIKVIREAGLGVTYETSGPATLLSPGIDLTAYRIVQEALTNALRHAPGASAAVRVNYALADVTIEVTNTAYPHVAAASGNGTPGPAAARRGYEPAGSGYGLAGIAERVASCGGALSFGPAADGGFTVTATLPLA